MGQRLHDAQRNGFWWLMIPRAEVVNTQEDDAALLRRIEDGDSAALTVLTQRHQGRLFGYLRSLARTPEQAEDALQETLIAVWRTSQQKGSAHQEGSVLGWMLTIARHALYRGVRLKAGEPSAPESLEALAQCAGWGSESDPERLLAAMESRQCLNRALNILDEVDREVLTLRDLHGFTGEETAQALGLGVTAVKSRLHRARLKLHARVREVCHEG